MKTVCRGLYGHSPEEPFLPRGRMRMGDLVCPGCGSRNIGRDPFDPVRAWCVDCDYLTAWHLAGGHYHYCIRCRTLEACDGSDCNGHCRRNDV
jgi:hypothetical protein